MRDTATSNSLIVRLVAGAAMALCVGAANAGEGPPYADPFADWSGPRQRHRVDPHRARYPAMGPAIVSGYLPRNHNVPMYNEPPRRPPSW